MRPAAPSPADRVPTPPDPVLRWVERYGTSRAAGAESAGPGGPGVPALETALGLPASEREAAWALLAADALLTWSVEDAADAPDPARALRTLLQAVGKVDPGTGVR